MMRSRALLIGLLVALLAFGSFGLTLAQDQLEPVDLVMWSTARDDEPTNGAIISLFDAWAAENAPGSSLEITFVETEQERNDLLTAGLAGSGLPDLFLGPNDPIGVYVDAGIVQPVDDLLDLTQFAGGAIEPAQLDAVTYGIPLSYGNHLMLLYNKQLVAEAPDTWEDLIATAQQVEADNPDVQGFAYNLNEAFWFVAFAGGFGGSVFNDDGSFALDSQPWIDAFQFVHDLKFTEEVVPQECDYDCMNSLFAEGGAAMIINGDWSLGSYQDAEPAPGIGEGNLGIAPWPALPNGERPRPFTAGRYVSIPVTTDGAKLAAIQSFLNYLLQPENLQTITVDIGFLPPTTAVLESEAVTGDELLSASAAALATGTGTPANIELRCMWDAVRPQLEGVMSDAVTAEDAAAEAQVSAEDCVADLE